MTDVQLQLNGDRVSRTCVGRGGSYHASNTNCVVEVAGSGQDGTKVSTNDGTGHGRLSGKLSTNDIWSELTKKVQVVNVTKWSAIRARKDTMDQIMNGGIKRTRAHEKNFRQQNVETGHYVYSP